MQDLYSKIQESIEYIKSLVQINAEHAIILGTGLGSYGSTLTDQMVINYTDIPHFPVATVQSHEGKMIFGYKFDIPVIVLAGRFHFYEGYSAQELTYPIRILKALGIQKLILTNAAGGINPHYMEGDLVMITDHINMLPDHPLRGPNDERIGQRFPDMLQAYNRELRSIFAHHAEQLKLKLKEGIYLGLQGPSLETPAEYRMAHILGADLVGMSTIPEVIVAKHCGIDVLAISIVSNACFPTSILTETTVDEVIKVVSASAGQLSRLLDRYFVKYSNHS
jgi:purine-nucleoside phosphorylase